jgi:hypothetical protein
MAEGLKKPDAESKRPPEEILSSTWHRLSLPLSRSNWGKHQGLRRGVLRELPTGFDYRPGLVPEPRIGASLCLVFSRPLKTALRRPSRRAVVPLRSRTSIAVP